MLYQRLCEQAGLLNEILEITSHDEPAQGFNRDLLNVRAIAGGKHERATLQPGVSPQDSHCTGVIRRQVSRIGSGHAHADCGIAKVKYFKTSDGVLQCHWRT